MNLVLNDLINKSKSIKLFGFTIFSGLGFAIDFGIFSILIYLNISVFISNIVAGFFAVSFVYFTSARHIFDHHNKFLLLKFIIYIIFNIFRVYFLSLIIVFLTVSLELAPIFPKILVLPVSLYTNFLFMNFLMTNKLKLY